MGRKGHESSRPESLLTCREVAAILRISRRHFDRLRPRLMARGLQRRRLGKRYLYRAASVDRLIAAKDESDAVLVMSGAES